MQPLTSTASGARALTAGTAGMGIVNPSPHHCKINKHKTSVCRHGKGNRCLILSRTVRGFLYAGAQEEQKSGHKFLHIAEDLNPRRLMDSPARDPLDHCAPYTEPVAYLGG